MLSFYSAGNGYFKINGKNIKVTISGNAKLPASQGYAWFRWGLGTYYIRFYRNAFYVYQFGRCKKVYSGVGGFCGSAKLIKGKRKANSNQPFCIGIKLPFSTPLKHPMLQTMPALALVEMICILSC